MNDRAMTPNDEREMALNRLSRIRPMLLEMHDIDGQLVQRTTDVRHYADTSADDSPLRAIVTLIAACECVMVVLFIVMGAITLAAQGLPFNTGLLPNVLFFLVLMAGSTYFWVYWEPVEKSWLKTVAPIVFVLMTGVFVFMYIDTMFLDPYLNLPSRIFDLAFTVVCAVLALFVYRRWRSHRVQGVRKANEGIAASNEAIANDMNAKLRRLQTLAGQVGTLCTDFCSVDCLSPKTVDFMGSLLRDKRVATMDQAVQELSKSELCDQINAANAQIAQGYALLAERRADDAEAIANGRAALLGALTDASTFYATSMTERGAIRYLRNVSEYGD